MAFLKSPKKRIVASLITEWASQRMLRSLHESAAELLFDGGKHDLPVR
jgi:hypothetical protein